MKLDRKPRPALSLAPGGPSLALGRAHEATGPAATVFAALVAGRLTGPVIWIRSAWARAGLCPDGLASLFDPSRLVIAAAPRPEDTLWSAEEALRSGAVPLVVAEVEAPPALTPLRRLQLAAEAGAEGAPAPPMALILPPVAGTAGAVESRWRCAPLPACGAPRWRFERVYSKAGPPMCWDVGLTEAAPARRDRAAA